jgi:hypothetical protein
MAKIEFEIDRRIRRKPASPQWCATTSAVSPFRLSRTTHWNKRGDTRRYFLFLHFMSFFSFKKLSIPRAYRRAPFAFSAESD